MEKRVVNRVGARELSQDEVNGVAGGLQKLQRTQTLTSKPNGPLCLPDGGGCFVPDCDFCEHG